MATATLEMLMAWVGAVLMTLAVDRILWPLHPHNCRTPGYTTGTHPVFAKQMQTKLCLISVIWRAAAKLPSAHFPPILCNCNGSASSGAFCPCADWWISPLWLYYSCHAAEISVIRDPWHGLCCLFMLNLSHSCQLITKYSFHEPLLYTCCHLPSVHPPDPMHIAEKPDFARVTQKSHVREFSSVL